MSDVYYRITATEGEEKGKFSNGGTRPSFKKVGKIWAQRNHVMAHLSQLSHVARATYKKTGAKIEEFIPEFQDELDISEYLDMTDDNSRLESLREFFLEGKVSSEYLFALVSEDLELQDARKLAWNRKKIQLTSEDVEKVLPIHAFGSETAQEWRDHQGYTNCPDEIKAMLLLEHEGSNDQIDRWIRAFVRKQHQ